MELLLCRAVSCNWLRTLRFCATLFRVALLSARSPGVKTSGAASFFAAPLVSFGPPLLIVALLGVGLLGVKLFGAASFLTAFSVTTSLAGSNVPRQGFPAASHASIHARSGPEAGRKTPSLPLRRKVDFTSGLKVGSV